MSVEDVDPYKLSAFLWDKHRIYVNAMGHAHFGGIGVSPNVHSTVQEVDTFSAAIESALRSGV